MAIELEDGTIVRSLPEQVDYLTTHNEENEIAIDNLAARLEAAIAGVLHYKGSVATYADLPADAEIGDVYNVIDTGANYAWTGSEWDELGSSIDISSLVDLTSDQTITGIKTFSTKIQLGDPNNSIGANNNELELKSGSPIRVYNNIRPSRNGEYSLGGRTLAFKEISLSHGINPNASGYGLTLPDTSGFTADKELGLAEGTLNFIKASEMTDTNHFTNDQLAILTNGKPTLINGVVSNYDRLFIFGLYLDGIWHGLAYGFQYGRARLMGISINQISNNLISFGPDRFDLNPGYFKNKAIPSYPSDTTKQYKLVQKVGGDLDWVEDI